MMEKRNDSLVISFVDDESIKEKDNTPESSHSEDETPKS